MKQIVYRSLISLAAVASLLSFASCGDRLPVEPQQGGVAVSLTLGDETAGNLHASTRATEGTTPEPGVNALYENKIHGTVVLFFPNLAEAPIVVETGVDEMIASVTDAADVVRIQAASTKIYAFANYDATQVAALKAVPNEAALLALTADAASATRSASVVQRRFLMTGFATRAAATPLSTPTPIKLERLAVKVRAKIIIKDPKVLAGWIPSVTYPCMTMREADKAFFVRQGDYTPPAGITWKNSVINNIFYAKKGTDPDTYFEAVCYTNERNTPTVAATSMTLVMPYGVSTDTDFDDKNYYTFNLPVQLKRNFIYDVVMTIKGKASGDGNMVYALVGVQEWKTGTTYNLDF